jgi:RND superfamily putative drug exporter
MPSDPHSSSQLGRLAAVTVRHPRRVLLAWIGALVAAIALGATAGGSFSVDYATPGSESQAAQRLLEERFGNRSEDTVDIVWTAPAGADDPAVRASVDGALAEISGLPGLREASTRQADIARDGSTGVVRVSIEGRADAVPATTGEAVRELVESSPGGVTMAAGGFIPGLEEEGVSAEMVGLAVALLVLLLTFGTAIAAGLPLLTAIFGLGISSSLIGVLAAVADTPDWAPQVGAMIGIGVGIDYALLVLTRHRAAMAAGKPVGAAVVEALSTAGRSVLVAGGTVVVSLAGLFLMGLPYLYGVALAAMISVLVVVAAALTLLPALLAMLGTRIERLRIPGVRRASEARPAGRTAGRWAAAVQRRPVIATVLATALLVALALPATGLRLGFPDAGNDPAGSTTRQAFDLLTAGFGEGANGPLTIVAETPEAEDRAAVEQLRGELAAEPGVASVSAVTASRGGDAAAVLVTPDPRRSPRRRSTSSTRCATDRWRTPGSRRCTSVGRRPRPSIRARRPRRGCRSSSAASSACRSCCCSPRSARRSWR